MASEVGDQWIGHIRIHERTEMPQNYDLPKGRYVAVFNTNPMGNLVVRLVKVQPRELSFSESAMTPSAKLKVITDIQNKLDPTAKLQKVVGISNLLPSAYGAGGAYVYHVDVEVPRVPPQPQFNIEVGGEVNRMEDFFGEDPYDPEPDYSI